MAKKPGLTTRELVAKIERLTRERMAKEKVVSLRDFRELNQRPESVTVLIIDDDETMRRALRRIFEDEGFRTITAADGTQLSTVLEESAIDIILLDVGLPWINGFELAQLMRESDELKHIPLIFVSGRGTDEDIKRGFAVGASDYITKPFEIEQIKKSVSALLKLR